MLNQLLIQFNIILDFLKNKIKYFYFILFLFLFLINFIFLPSFKAENFIYLFLNSGFLYVLNVFIFLKTSIYLFFYNLMLLVFFNFESQVIYSFILNFFYIFNYKENNNLKIFYDFFIYNMELNLLYFNSEFLYSKNFTKIIILNSNLPIFFYFCLLFIMTTLFSLLLLSYLGLYGVFFLNLITILLF